MSRHYAYCLVSLAWMLAFAHARQLAPQADVGTKEVVVTGRAANPEDARKNARMAALDRAVGALVDAKTRITNTVIVEEVISASAGFVEKFEVVEEGRSADGGHYVVAKIAVRANLLKQRLIEQKLVTAPVDGESAVAQALSKAASVAEAATYLENNLRTFPASAMKVRLAGPLEVVDDTSADWVAGIKVEVSLDVPAWEIAMNAMRDTLEVVARGRYEWRADASKDVWSSSFHEPTARDGAVRLSPWDSSFGEFRSAVLESKDPTSPATPRWPEESVLVSVPSRASWREPFTAYAVPRPIIIEIARLLARDVELTVVLRDKDGVIVRTLSLGMPLAPLPACQRWVGGMWRAMESNTRWIDGEAALERRGASFDMSMLNCMQPGDPWHLLLPPGLLGEANVLNSALYCNSQTIRIAFALSREDIQRTASVDLQLKSKERRVIYRHEARRAVSPMARELTDIIFGETK